MNKLSKNENGFGALEVLLILIIVVLAGVIGWMVYKNHHKITAAPPPAYNSVKSTSKSSTNTSKSTQSTNPYSGWKTYTSSYQNISFQYPSTWSLKTDPNSNASGAINATLTSPNGYVLQYNDDAAGYGGACQPGQPDVALSSVVALTTANSSKPIYLVTSGSNLGLYTQATPPTAGDTGSCAFYALTLGTKAGTQVALASNVQFPFGTPKTLPSSQTQDFATAQLILKSFKYDN